MKTYFYLGPVLSALPCTPHHVTGLCSGEFLPEWSVAYPHFDATLILPLFRITIIGCVFHDFPKCLHCPKDYFRRYLFRIHYFLNQIKLGDLSYVGCILSVWLHLENERKDKARRWTLQSTRKTCCRLLPGYVHHYHIVSSGQNMAFFRRMCVMRVVLPNS